jgi:hypothetical protein
MKVKINTHGNALPEVHGERWKAMKDILYGLGAVLLLALMVIWGLALALAGPALLKFCILYLFG